MPRKRPNKRPTSPAAPVESKPQPQKADWTIETVPTAHSDGSGITAVTLVAAAERSDIGSTYTATGNTVISGFDPRRDLLALVGHAGAEVARTAAEMTVTLPDGGKVTLRLR